MKRLIYLLALLLVLIIAVPICAKRYADYMEKKRFEQSTEIA